MLLLCDHTSRNEYNVESAKARKVYKAINKYADLVIDLNLNSFSRESENSGVENISRYENTFTTEDDVTSFFGTILMSLDGKAKRCCGARLRRCPKRRQGYCSGTRRSTTCARW